MRENWKRIVLGLVLVILIIRISSYFFSLYEPSDSITPREYLSVLRVIIGIALILKFVAYSVGGFVARTNFLVPAAAYAIFVWVNLVVALARFDKTEEGAGFTSDVILSATWSALPQLPIQLLVAIAGSAAGMALYRRSQQRLK